MKSGQDLKQILRMLVSDEDLRKLDDAHLKSLSHEQLLAISMHLSRDLKEARDRMNQNPGNSSRPPSTQAPWESWGIANGEQNERETPSGAEDEQAKEAEGGESSPGQDTTKPTRQERRPAGKQRGAPGYGRKLEMVVTGEVIHRAPQCSVCGVSLGASAPFSATTGLYVVDIEMGPADAPGLTLSHTKHLYGETSCACGHVTPTEPGRCPAEAEWRVPLTEHHLVGAMLASLIVCLALRMRLSRATSALVAR